MAKSKTPRGPGKERRGARRGNRPVESEETIAATDADIGGGAVAAEPPPVTSTALIGSAAISALAQAGLGAVGTSLALGAVSVALSRLLAARPEGGGDEALAAPALQELSLSGIVAPVQTLATQVEAPFLAEMGDLQIIPFNFDTPMDPRLQLAIANRRSGKRSLALASTDADEVAVIARVTTPPEWEDLPDLQPGSTLGQDGDGSWIVTGRVPISRVEDVRKEACVLSMKAAQQVRPTLSATIDKMHVGPAALPTGTAPGGGSGVVVGVVDFGCDYAHKNFQDATGKTRIEAIWDQGGVEQANAAVKYGRLYTNAQIDAALATQKPYDTLGYAPPPDTGQDKGTHGTHVLDIAAGNGLGSGQAGVAPEASIIFVEASTTDIPWTGAATVHKSFGDSVHLLEAVEFIFDRAGDRPCVVNISLGTNGGPHDGTSLVEKGLDVLVTARPNRAVVIAAGNAHAQNIHTSGTVVPDEQHDIVWEQNGNGGEFELWYPGNRSLEVTFVAPDGTAFGPVSGNANLPIGAGNRISIFISSRLADPNNNDNVINIYLAEAMSPHPWRIRLRSIDGQPVDYHAWIERADFVQSSFTVAEPSHTLGSVSTGHQTIVVGSFDAHKTSLPLSTFSGAGPTRDGRNKPEVSAPGHAVVAARSRTAGGVTRKSGTSMAAPAVTGLIALIYAEARRNGTDLTIAQLRDKLIGTALGAPPSGAPAAWDPRYGFGRADGAAIG